MKLGKKIVQREIHGEPCYIRPLNGGAKAAHIIELLQQVGSKPQLIGELGAYLVSCCLCDEAGEALFPDPAKVMEDASLGFLNDFTQAALEISGLGDDAKEIAGNSEAVQ